MTDAELREAAREILAREDYARWREPPGPAAEWLRSLSEWMARVSDWLAGAVPQWLRDLFSAFGSESYDWYDSYGDELSGLLWAIGVLAALLVIWVGAGLLRAWLALGRSQQTLPPDSDSPSAALDLRVRAEALAGEGRFLDAAHAVQLAALEVVLARRFIELGRSDPNRTLRERLAGSALPPPELGQFLALLDRLETQWFGERAAGSPGHGLRGLYEAWCELYARLERLGEPA